MNIFKIKLAKISLLMSIFLIASFVMVSLPFMAGAEDEDNMILLPVILSPEAPPGDYDYNFDANIDPWNIVRWRGGSTYTLGHDSGGQLELKVKDSNAYAIASPVVQGPTRPYSINFSAKFDGLQDKHQYGVIFGADRVAGETCPNTNLDSCFNKYYEFRVRYRNDNGVEYVEYRINKVTAHDGANQPIFDTLLDWTQSDVSNFVGHTKWTISFRESGNMTVKANNREQAGFARDSGYGDNLYFGVMARTSDQGDVTALFDSFKIAADASQ